MKGRLIARSGQDAGKTWLIEDEVTLGRGPENRVRVKNERVSTRHARIFLDPKAHCFMLEDLNSRNGTRVAGLYVRGPEKLLPLDIICLAGTVEFIFQVLPERRETRPPA
jgi:pSer/pThr/pTyr-binding forkhead associated (FHA) protein